MIFLNFSQFSESVFCLKQKENTFLKTKPNFSWTEKCFSLINVLNNKQTYESLESDFQKIIFHQTNEA
jgi:TRAP-type C4-dicarboxylate transport system substrate-binding protein